MIPKKNLPPVDKTPMYKKVSSNPFATASADFIASILLILLLFIVAIRPTIVTINKLQEKIEELNDFNTKLESKISTVKALIPEFQTNKQLLAFVNEAIPDRHEFPEFEKQIRTLLYRNRMQLFALSFSGFPLLKSEENTVQEVLNDTSLPTTDTMPGVISFSVTAQGSYPEAKAFVSQMQNLIRVVRIDTVDFEKSGGSEIDDSVLLTLRGEVYSSE